MLYMALYMEGTALTDEYFVKRRLYPNVNSYSSLIYRALGFDTEFFPVLFAIPCMAGYLTHWKESLDGPNTKLMRSQQWYMGVWLRHYYQFLMQQEGIVQESMHDFLSHCRELLLTRSFVTFLQWQLMR